MKYSVGIVGIDGEVIRWITMLAANRDDVVAKMDRKYWKDDTVIGYHIEAENLR